MAPGRRPSTGDGVKTARRSSGTGLRILDEPAEVMDEPAEASDEPAETTGAPDGKLLPGIIPAPSRSLT